MKMRRLGLEPHFSRPGFGGFGSDHTDRGQLIKVAVQRCTELVGEAPMRVVHIGDTPNDVKAANFAGAAAVGVCTGVFTREELEQSSGSDADTVLPDLTDIPVVLRALGLAP